MKTDLEIQKDVMDEFRWEPLFKASEIGVAVKNGIVTLSGVVDNYVMKRAAEEAAIRVSGVNAVAEDIDVRLSTFGTTTDADLAQAVVNALKWNSSVPDEKFKVKVENKWVTLEGEVEYEFQRRATRNAVENLSGVLGINNKIKLVPKIKATEIKNKINAAFQRSATVDANKITITADGSKVTLSGKVRSFVEKRDAERAAWAAPGVAQLENKIEIDSEIYVY
jgi:osmotically-inducible protein OsmY